MLEVILNAANGEVITVALEDQTNGHPTKLSDLCFNQAVCEWFDAEPYDIMSALETINCVEIADEMRAARLNAALEDGAILSFNLDAAFGDDDVDEDEQADEVDNQQGSVTVYTSGRLRHADVPIINGQTSLYDAIHSVQVREMSGRTDEQLTNYFVSLNDTMVHPETLQSRALNNGDIIDLSPNAIKTHGRK